MQIRHQRGRAPSRRTIIRTAAAVGVAAGVGPFVHTSPARAAKAMKILQWSHFVPGYDKWFNNAYVKEWGAKNDTEVVVDNINLGLIPSRAAAEVSAQKGHDLVMFLAPPSVYEEQVVDMKDPAIEGRSRKRHGRLAGTPPRLRPPLRPRRRRRTSIPDRQRSGGRHWRPT